MSPRTSLNSVRVERALRVFPEVDVLAPLRALVIARSRATPADAPHLTVGKRSVQPKELDALIPEAVARFGQHLTAVYARAASALAAEARGDIAAAVTSLLEASALEVEQGREPAAQVWAEHALGLAELAPDRHPEIDAVLALAELDLARGAFERAARRAQRALAIAEAALANDSVAAACLVLGRVAAARNTIPGAVAWLMRGLELAIEDAPLRARFELNLGEVLARRGSLQDASARLLSAESAFRVAGEPSGVAQALSARARISAGVGRPDEALLLFREALMMMLGTVDPARIAHGELGVRLRLCHFLLHSGQLVDAEDEARRAEEVAIEHSYTRELARVYLVLGGIRAAQRDETGMVFFEKAIELCRGTAPTLHLEADAYHGYAEFCRALHHTEEAAAYLERERELRDLMTTETALL